MWTYEPRQGRKAATVVCSASAVVTLAFQYRTRFASVAAPHEAGETPAVQHAGRVRYVAQASGLPYRRRPACFPAVRQKIRVAV